MILVHFFNNEANVLEWNYMIFLYYIYKLNYVWWNIVSKEKISAPTNIVITCGYFDLCLRCLSSGCRLPAVTVNKVPVYVWIGAWPLPSNVALQWRHNERDCVSNHQPHACLLNRLFRRRSKKTPKLRVTGLCAGNSPVTREFPAQRAINAENVSIWWRYHALSLVGSRRMDDNCSWLSRWCQQKSQSTVINGRRDYFPKLQRKN